MNYVRATKLLAILAAAAVLLCLYAAFVPGVSGAWAIVAVSLLPVADVPTIYGWSLRGLGPDTKFGAAFLVMAIVGGAIMPAVMGAVTDATNAAIAFHRARGLLRIRGRLWPLRPVEVAFGGRRGRAGNRHVRPLMR